MARTGKQLTQQKIIDLLANWGTENMESIKRILIDTAVPLKSEEIKAYRKYQVSTGIETSPEQIDEIIYGD